MADALALCTNPEPCEEVRRADANKKKHRFVLLAGLLVVSWGRETARGAVSLEAIRQRGPRNRDTTALPR